MSYKLSPPREHSIKIPKVIHYCWFGGNPKPEIVERCIASWRKFCPDWEIIEWNESNFDISQHSFMEEAYSAKKWAFVSDVARLLIIYQYGGVYLDTDVELKKSLDDQLQYDSFFAFESLAYINSGLGFGASAKHPHVKAMLDSYTSSTFDPRHLVPCPVINTKALMTSCPTLERNGNTTQIIGRSAFYSIDDYCSFSNHLGAMSWVDKGETPSVKRPRSKASISLQNWLKTPKKITFIEEHFGESVMRLYVFFAYDFFDSGILYLLKRKLSHLRKEREI